MLGRAVVADGRLRELREGLGLSRFAMSELLHTAPRVYTAWEENPATRLWPATASRAGRFYTNAIAELAYVKDVLQVDVSTLVPLYMAASELGTTQELLLKWYRDGRFVAEDLGILGLWVYRDAIGGIRR